MRPIDHPAGLIKQVVKSKAIRLIRQVEMYERVDHDHTLGPRRFPRRQRKPGAGTFGQAAQGCGTDVQMVEQSLDNLPVVCEADLATRRPSVSR